MPGRFVNLGDPANLSHPLNRNRMAWWKFLAGGEYVNGRLVVDLIGISKNRRRYDGKIVTNTRFWPQQQNRGFGSIGPVALGGPTASIDVTSFPASSLTSAVTMSCWALITATTEFGCTFKIGNVSPAGGWGIGCGGGTINQFQTAGSPSNWAALIEGISWVATSTPITLGWHHLVYTIAISPNAETLYVDGQQLAQTSHGSVGATNDTYLLGYDATAGGGSTRYWPDRADSFSIWNVVLTPAQVGQLYLEETAGCPNTLNRITGTRQAFGIPVANAVWLYKA